ncbi:hypothetical protein ES707_15871 [subsurface metagenome]
MVSERKGPLSAIEEKLGLPSLSTIFQSLEKFPDTTRLRLIKDILISAERVSKVGPELDKVVELIVEVNSMPIEKLDKLEKLLRRLEKVMKNAPSEIMEFLNSLQGD